MVEEMESESALHENINRKGSNSYYYAHGNTAKGPAWDGREEPRLLSTSIAPPVISVTKAMMASFESFSWLDENKYVKVYIEYDGANDIADEDISLVSCHLVTAIVIVSTNNVTGRYCYINVIIILRLLLNILTRLPLRNR